MICLETKKWQQSKVAIFHHHRPDPLNRNLVNKKLKKKQKSLQLWLVEEETLLIEEIFSLDITPLVFFIITLKRKELYGIFGKLKLSKNVIQLFLNY